MNGPESCIEALGEHGEQEAEQKATWNGDAKRQAFVRETGGVREFSFRNDTGVRRLDALLTLSFLEPPEERFVQLAIR